MSDDPTRPTYRREGSDTLVEIRLNEVRQLFHTLDPAPFHEKDLDENAAAYLLEACDEAGSGRPLRLVVHLPTSEAQTETARTLARAVNNYFAYRERQLRKDLLKLLRYGAISLVIGLVFLMACLALRRALLTQPLIVDQAIVDEGLLILGWVAMWRPIEVLLYDWWPLARRRSLLRRLAIIPVEVRAKAD
ncbi:MAG: hypothetical protein ABL964_07105 [Steroidobacteraceae bacterium]